MTKLMALIDRLDRYEDELAQLRREAAYHVDLIKQREDLVDLVKEGDALEEELTKTVRMLAAARTLLRVATRKSRA